MTTTQTRNQIARYWKYTGNHHNGKDCDRDNPYQYNAGLVGFAAYIGDGGDYQAPVTYEMTQQIKVKHCKGDDLSNKPKTKEYRPLLDVVSILQAIPPFESL